MSACQYIVFACLLLLFYLTQPTVGLTCYVCARCNDPFNASATNVIKQTVPDNQGYFCNKVNLLGYVVRNVTQNCTERDILGNGVWCCQKDLCNDAKNIVTASVLVVALVLGFVIILW
ncbi:unnamed protein product [Rotaria sordida]|uniref:Uncharacterized protein n=1 Tax=Rotaria sordida TaxID=392033 RepID=A0A815H5S6_9BILA|nr:unnamed protein product [Rotaria sordida]